MNRTQYFLIALSFLMLFSCKKDDEGDDLNTGFTLECNNVFASPSNYQDLCGLSNFNAELLNEEDNPAGKSCVWLLSNPNSNFLYTVVMASFTDEANTQSFYEELRLDYDEFLNETSIAVNGLGDEAFFIEGPEQDHFVMGTRKENVVISVATSEIFFAEGCTNVKAELNQFVSKLLSTL